MKSICDGLSEVDRLPEPTLPVKYPRTPGYRPAPEENKLNGWYWKTDIEGAKTGKLAGKKVAIKDNIAVAGVPMMNGCTVMEGYIPEFDATVVTRVLDAGGRILGKSTCEGFCLSANAYTCNKGPVLNFHNPLHSAGGSSGGSGTLVASGEVDMAIGGDQGGSVRLPSCWCGIVGMKPSYGLVPYTGAMSIEPCLDHLGPMARTVNDCALFLEVLAGYDDGMDPRQPPNIVVPEYTKELQVDNLNGMKIGLLKEGFGLPQADPRVDQMEKDTVTKLTEAGATVEEMSIPIHAKGPSIWNCFGVEGAFNTMIQQQSTGIGYKGFYPTSMTSFQGRSMKTSVNDLSHTMKMTLLFGEYLKENYPGRFYSKGQNVTRLIVKGYAEALEKYDVVAMPTIPWTAAKLPGKDVSTFDYMVNAFASASNTMVANVTGLPALSVNAGFVDGLPVGALFTGRMFDEVTLFKVGHVFEKLTSCQK
ncbi:amidase-like isoform X2 [Apostichopus japonicus]